MDAVPALPAHAGALRGASVAITFKQQPRTVIRPELPAAYLAPLDERIALLHQIGVDAVIPIDFDDSVRLLTARLFTSLLRRHLGMSQLVLGPQARIGHDRIGGRKALGELAREGRFDLLFVEGEYVDGAMVSSSGVREALAAGRIAAAGALLGRPYALAGAVVSGDGRGRRLGFPTANLSPPGDLALPGDGVYAAWAYTPAGRHAAAVSIGVRPTFGDGGRAIEAYLLDFEGDLYGQSLRLEFMDRLRDQQAFAGADELTRQMHADVAAARIALSLPVEAGTEAAT